MAKKVIETRADGSIRVRTIFEKPSRTQKHFAEGTNINNIMKKYRMRDFPGIDPTSPLYRDFSKTPDYATALQKTIDAEEAFINLPSEIRQRFNHDPMQLIHFVGDPKNKEEAIKLKLVPKPAPPKKADPLDLSDDTIKKIKTERKAKVVYED